MDKWFEFRSEDMNNMFSFQDTLNVILKFVPDERKDDVIKLIDEYDEKYCTSYTYWVNKYYIAGWNNSTGLLN